MELTPAPFHFSSVQKFSHRRGAHIKKLILWKLIGVPNNIGEGVDPFPDPVRHFGPPGGHFRFCSQCGNADCEQMLPMLIGCFYPPPHFSVGTSSIWTSVCVSECPKNTVFLRPLHCVFLRPSVLLRFFVPLWVVLSPPSSMCMLLFIIDQISLSPAQAKSLYGGVRWGLGTHLPQSCWDFFPLSTFPLDGVFESKTWVCSLDFAVGAALQVVSVWPFCC